MPNLYDDKLRITFHNWLIAKEKPFDVIPNGHSCYGCPHWEPLYEKGNYMGAACHFLRGIYRVNSESAVWNMMKDCLPINSNRTSNT